ncbi:SDR family oxidoreductase [Pseudonocardia spirodelae]|uniref:SDR family oxidoreductase n=1 Tax=Pseudonocardia spirodelae TaxID=3133431 RepID=A0ABU8T6P5_9PSEU
MSGVAVVTGAGSGIGAAVTGGLLDAGWRVALAGRRRPKLDEVAAGRPADTVLTVAADVTDPGSVDALFDAVRDRWGRVDLLVNNAGSFGAGGTVDEISVEDWQAAVAVNLTGSFLCARAAFGAMRRQDPQGGRIINNGSISAHVPRPGSAPYTATKHAVTGLTKSLSLDGRRFGIACGQIDIGNAATEMTAGIATGATQADGTVAPEATFDVRHVADAVVYMAGLPPEANVQFLTVAATTMPWLARG